MRVSVIIPTIGRPELLRSCLASVAASTRLANEVVVADQSPDGAARVVVDELAAADGLAGLRRVVADGVGPARCRNVGAAAATGDVLLFTDDDCVVEPGWIAAALDGLDRHGDAFVRGPILDGGDGINPSHIAAGPEQVSERDLLLPSGNMGLRREWFEAVGGFDESYAGAAEDRDLGYRLVRAGYRNAFLPGMTVRHTTWRPAADLAPTWIWYARGLGEFHGRYAWRDRRLAREVAYLLWDTAKSWVAPGSVTDPAPGRARVPHYFIGVASGLRRLVRR